MLRRAAPPPRAAVRACAPRPPSRAPPVRRMSVTTNRPRNAWWKDEPIKFKCTGCGKCCHGKPGYVWLLEEDIVNISGHLKMERAAFMDKYVRYIPEAERYSLKEVVSEDWRCILLTDDMKYCKVYPVRPTQCRTYPYWPAVMSSKERWEEEAQACEGINHKDAEAVPVARIREQLDEQFRRVLAPAVFGLDIGPVPSTAGMPSKPK